MEKFNLILVLLACFLINQSFSQKVKEGGKSQTKISQIAKADPDSKAYCLSTYTNQTDDWITNVNFNSINNYSGQDGTTSYGDYTSINTGLLVGSTYTLSVTFYSKGLYTEHVWAWFDWNSDDDFYDAGESYDLGDGIDATLTMNITVPAGATVGASRMRIIEQYNSNPVPCGDPHPTIYGETEDYSIYINSNPRCAASGGCDEYISAVSIEGLYEPSDCDGYMDYTPIQCWNMPINTSALITVTNGYPYTPDQCGIWVDWNMDNDFYDANETITVSGTPGVGPYTATLIAPPGAAYGIRAVRVRLTYTGSVNPCGTFPYGEVEDHAIALIPEVPCTWNGSVDNNWHNPDNWNTINIPDATDDVIIPNVTNKCWVYVYGATAECKNLTVEAGTTHDLRIYNTQLTVHGNMEAYGMVTLDHPVSKLKVEGNINWQSGSTLFIPDLTYAIVRVEGDWITQPGSNIYFNHGLLSFEGTGGSYLRTFSSNSNFYDIAAYKTGGTQWVSISSNSTQDLNINGRLMIMQDDILYVYSPHDVNLKGDLDIMGHLYCYDGDFVFNGDIQEIDEDLAYSTTCEFHYLVLNSSISTTILNKDITVSEGLRIESGQFIPNDHTITVNGYWYNQLGPAGFVEGNGRVIFTGTSSNIYGDENFNILELNKSTNFYHIQIDGNTVTCQHYDWTNGSVYASNGGTFTAYDLVDNGIYGGWVTSAGTINISNYGTDQYVDLNGEITLYSGFMNVYGGYTPSYWPFAANAEINISSGVLDFHDQGIYIYDSPTYSLTENITGGIIRTAGGFWGESSNFSPDYGITEFYGSTDASIYTINGCNLNRIRIDKSSKGDNKTNLISQTYTYPLIDERSGKLISDGSKSNTLEMTGFVDINGSVEIESGILNTNGHSIQVVDHWTNNVGDAGFIESTGTVFFDGTFHSWLYTDETFYNLILNKPSFNNSLNTLQNVEIDVLNDLSIDDGIFYLTSNSKLRIDGNMFIAFEAGLNAASGSEIEIGGNWTNENYSNTQNYGFWPGGEIITFDGATDQILNTNASEESFTHVIINKSGGYFRPNDNTQIFGELQVLNGNWWDYTTSLTHYIYGNFIIGASGNYYPEGITCFKGTSDQVYENYGGIGFFKDVIIDKTATKDNNAFVLNEKTDNAEIVNTKGSKSMTLTLNSDMVVFNDHTTIVEEGTLNLNGHLYKATGWVDIKDGSNIIVNAGARLSLGHRLFVYTGGQLTATGDPGNMAWIYNEAAGQDYSIEIFGGTISANHTIFEDLGSTGLWVHDGSFVDPVNSFNNCSFDGYTSPAGSTWLIIDNNEVITIDNISFPNHPGGANASNIGKNMGMGGHITITNASGAFAGPMYEYDPDELIDWSDYVPGLWTGNVSSDWFDPNNWGDFNVPGTATDVVIPAGALNYPIVNNSTAYCNILTIEAGASLEIGNNELHITNYFDNSGHFIMTNSLAKLHVVSFWWFSGSTANITSGEIYASTWIWGNGTNALLGTGNTVYLDWSIGQYDADAAFGNLILLSGQTADGSDPVRVSGNLTLSLGANWDTYADWIIDGDWIIGYSALLHVLDGAQIVCNSSFTLDSELYILNTSVVTVHGMLNFNTGGFMVVDNGTFICDHTLSSGWIEILGGIDMVSGSIEFPDANISFSGGQYISGGTIIAGRSVRANPAGVFQPTGGKLELVGSDAGHYLQITNGNYLNELFVNRSAPIGIHPGSPLTTQGSVDIYSELMAQGNTITSYGDVDIGGGGGILNLDNNAILEMENNRWLAINMNGTLEVIGSPGNEATITHTTGHYTFWIGNGATISAEHAVFEYMGMEGIWLRLGAMVDPAYPFDNCTFRNGIAGGRLLTINSNQNFTATNTIFPANTWGGAYNAFKDVDEGTVNFTNSTGAFSGESYEHDLFNRIHWGVPEVRLDLTVFLEGPFNPSSNIMYLDLHGEIPWDQPYDSNPSADWYYEGLEYVNPIPGFVVDWVVIDLRDATSAAGALPGTSIAKKAAFVLSTGEVVDLDGSNMLTFTVTVTNDLYVTIWHRNHTGVMSAVPLVESGEIYSYDFSSGGSQVHGGTSAHKQLSTSPVIWGMMAGDADGNGDIQLLDIDNVWSSQAGSEGYLESDFNMDTQSDNKDKNDYWLPNDGEGTYIPE